MELSRLSWLTLRCERTSCWAERRTGWHRWASWLRPHWPCRRSRRTLGTRERKGSSTKKTHFICLFFKFFWCAPFGYLHFLYFCVFVCNSLHHLHPSSIWCRGLKPWPLDHEPSALTNRPWHLANILYVNDFVSLIYLQK